MGFHLDSLFNNNGERDLGSESSRHKLGWRRAVEDEEWRRTSISPKMAAWKGGLAAAWFSAVPLNRDYRSKRQRRDPAPLRTQCRPASLAGAGAQWETGTAPFRFTTGPKTERQYRAFTNLDWRITPTWQLNLGGLVEKSTDTTTQLIPRAFLNWQASASDTFRAGYARAWQPRNLFNYFGDVRVDPQSGKLIAWPYLPNPNLRRARIDSFEVGYLGRFRAIDSTLDVRIFNERISHFVVRQIAFMAGQLPCCYRRPSSSICPTRSCCGIEYQFQGQTPAGQRDRLQSHPVRAPSREPGPASHRTQRAYVASTGWLQSYGRGWQSTASCCGWVRWPAAMATCRDPPTPSVPTATLDLRTARAASPSMGARPKSP